jgi:hypothetical protein
MKLRWSLPAVEYVTDRDTRRILVSVRDNMQDMVGNLLSKDDLVAAGVLQVDANGQYSLAKQKSSTSSSSTTGSSNIVYKSCIFSIIDGVVTLNMTIPQNSRIIRSWYEVLLAFTGDPGATMGIRIRYDGVNSDLVTPTGSLASFWSLGQFDGSQTGSAGAFSEKTTQAAILEYYTPTGNVTNGRANIFIQYATFN